MSEDNRKRSFTFSSEHPVDRWFGKEILDHSPKSVRMGFMSSGRAPLLMSHDQRQVIGIIEQAAIDAKSRVGRGVARFGRSNTASDALRDVDDEILVNTSVGYRVHELTLEKQSDTDGDTYRVTDWEPMENSLCGIPADPDVGMGRVPDAVRSEQPKPAADAEAPAAPQVLQPTATTAERTLAMETIVPAAAPANLPAPAVDSLTAVQAEAQRRNAVIALCKANKIDPRVEHRWINEGIALTQISDEILQVVEERTKHKPSGLAMLGLSKNETERYSLFKAIRAKRWGQEDRRFIEEAQFELECTRAIAKKLDREGSTSILIPTEVLRRPIGLSDDQMRAMASQPGSKGGYMVNVENMGFIDILRNRSVAMRMGARQLQGLVGNVVFPRQTGKSSVTWQGGDGASVTATDQALGQLSMTPKTAIIVTDVSEQFLRQASPSAEAFVTADLAATIAIDGVDNAVLNGAGGAQPLGIKNTTGITTGQDAASATYAKILAFPTTAGGVNAIRGNPGWVTNTAGASRLLQVQRFSSTDTPLWVGNLLDGLLVGFPAMSSEQVAANGLIFGSWDEVVIGDWGVLEIATDNGGTRFNQAQVGIRALWMVDVMLRYPQSFVLSSNLS
jgi:HK97 family phage major capsid protein